MAPFNAPAVLPNGFAPARCHSWRYFNRRVYTNPCSGPHNYRVNFSPRYADDCLHGSHTPQGVQNNFNQAFLHCRHQDHATNQRTHRICRYCIAATEDQQWFKLAQKYFVAKQPRDSHSNVSRHFLTRLCRVCEEREMILLNQRNQNDNALRPPLPPLAQRNAMVDWPRNTCTCKKAALDPSTRCRPHRREHYAATMPRLNAQRVANREWLQRVELDATGTPRFRENPDDIRRLDIHREGERRRGRLQRPQLMRACRCGADPVGDVDQAQVLLCMSCEGIVHVHHPPEFDAPPLPPTPPHLLLMNSYTRPDMFRLQRNL